MKSEIDETHLLQVGDKITFDTDELELFIHETSSEEQAVKGLSTLGIRWS